MAVFAVSRGAISALLSVGLLGCSLPNTSVAGAPRPSPPSAAKPHALDPGWSLHRDASAGFAVAFPDAWEKAQRDSPTIVADLAAIDARTPDLGPYLRANLTAGNTTGLALLAADPSSLTLGYATNLAVFRNHVGAVAAAPDLDGVRRAKIRALGTDSTIGGGIRQQRVRLGGVDAERIAYTFKAGTRSVDVVAYLLLVDVGKQRFEYELSMGGTSTDHASLFDKISSSFTLAQPASARPSVSPVPSR